MSETAAANSKVLFRVANEDGSAEVETLWASLVGPDAYRLENSPFWAYGVSWEDVVLAPFSIEEGFPAFQSVVSKSGNRTVRIALDPPLESGNESHALMNGLVDLGCSWEGMNRRYVSVNVPRDVELDAVRDYLVEKNAQWEHADPTYASLHPDDA